MPLLHPYHDREMHMRASESLAAAGIYAAASTQDSIRRSNHSPAALIFLLNTQACTPGHSTRWFRYQTITTPARKDLLARNHSCDEDAVSGSEPYLQQYLQLEQEQASEEWLGYSVEVPAR